MPRPVPPADRPMLITGADSLYFPLVQELHASIAAACRTDAPPLGVIDAGLTASQTGVLRARGVTVVRPSDMAGFPTSPLPRRPALAVNLSKPWLDRLFPGHATLVWLDADTWVQDYRAIDMLVGAAARGGLAVVPGGGRFWDHPIDVRWVLGGLWGLAQIRSFNFKNGANAGLPPRMLRDLGRRPLLNAGVFALRADAAHWRSMRAWQQTILRRGKAFTSDQLAMALAVYQDELPVELLPEHCNYSTRWRVDPGEAALVEYYYPYAKVGIVHLAGQKTMRFDPAVTTAVEDLDGGFRRISLRFGHFQHSLTAVRCAG